MKPLVSVLMSAYNAQDFVAQAVESVLSQSLEEVELVVVDDASTDGTATILACYAERDARVRLLRRSRNRGFIENRNWALQHARGTFVCMLDADDWLSSDALQHGVAAFSDTQIDCVVLRLISHASDGSVREHELPKEFRSGPIAGMTAFLLSLDWRLHGLMLVRRKYHLRYPYDTSLRWYTDDNTSRIHYLHARLVVSCRGEYHYRRHEQSGTIAITPVRFLHAKANWIMAQILHREGLPLQVRQGYEKHRWHNYLSLLRIYHKHGRCFSSQERHEVRLLLRDIYATFDRSVPFWLFEMRQYGGMLWNGLCGCYRYGIGSDGKKVGE